MTHKILNVLLISILDSEWKVRYIFPLKSYAVCAFFLCKSCPSHLLSNLGWHFKKWLYNEITIVNILIFSIVCRSLKMHNWNTYSYFDIYWTNIPPGIPRWHSKKKNLPVNSGDTNDVRLIPGFEKILWSRKWQCTQISLFGKFHG